MSAVDDTPLPGPWGVLAEFRTPQELVDAAMAVRREGYRKVDAYSPFPIEALEPALRIRRSRLPLLVALAGISGFTIAWFAQWFSRAVHYPLNLGGKPLYAWPLFIPPAYETTILFAGLSTFFGMLLFNGLPAPYHPVFNVPQFEKASQDGFFLSIESADDNFDAERTREFLLSLGAVEVYDVAR
jgi:hypothetical protein